MKEAGNSITRVAIFGYFGAGNLGDEAVVDVVIEAIRARWPAARIDGICLNPEAAAREHGIPGFPLRRMGGEGAGPTADLPLGRRLLRRLSRIAPSEVLFLMRARRWLQGTDLILVGGSGQLIDDEGGPWNHAYNHLKWVWLARSVGARFSFLSVGAGPLNTRMGKFLIRHSLESAEYVSFRDEFSRSLATSIGVQRRMEIYPDQAFGISSGTLAVSSKGGYDTIGVAPMAYCDPRHWSTHDSAAYARYLSELADVVVALVKKAKSVLLFHTQVNGDDRAIPDLLAIVEPRLDSGKMRRISEYRVASPADALHAIAHTDLVIASRFHAILFALNMRKPVVGISYHQKVVDLMAAFGQGRFAVPIDTFTSADVLNCVDSVEAESSALLATIGGRLLSQRKLLDEQYDRVLGKGGLPC